MANVNWGEFTPIDKPAAPAADSRKVDWGQFEPVKQDRSYIGASAEAGWHSLLAGGARVLEGILPTTDYEELAALYKNDPAKLKDVYENSAAMAIARFAEEHSARSKQIMSEANPNEQGAISGKNLSDLKYATMDPQSAAYLSPTRVAGDVLESLPTTAALMAAAYFTKGKSLAAAEQAEKSALARGMSAAEAKAAAKQAAIETGAETMARTGAVTEGAAGYGVQYDQALQDAKDVKPEVYEQSPEYQALIQQGYTPETARAKLQGQVAKQSGLIAGAVDATTSAIGGRYLGKIIGEGGSLLGRTARGFGTEALTEAPQSGGEQLGQNLAMRAINPNQSATEGVGEAMAAGLVVGGVTGGGTASVFGSRQRQVDAQEQAAQQALGTAKDVGTAIEAANQLAGNVNELSAAVDEYLGKPISDQPPVVNAQQSIEPGSPALRSMADRNAAAIGEANAAGFAADRQNALAQAEAALPEPKPRTAADFADLTPMNRQQAEARLAVLRDMTAQEGGNALELAVVPHPGGNPERFAIGKQALPSLEMGQAPAPISQEAVQHRLETAALSGKVAQAKAEDQNSRQVVIDRALRNVEERGGVASPAEAKIFQEAGLGKPYDRIDTSLAPSLSMDQQLTQATGIALDAAPREQGSESQRLAKLTTANNESMAEVEARSQSNQQQAARELDAQINEANKPSEAPAVNDVISALAVPGAQRSAEQNLTIRQAEQRMDPADFSIAQRAATAPFQLSQEERMRLRDMRTAPQQSVVNTQQVGENTDLMGERVRAALGKPSNGNIVTTNAKFSTSREQPAGTMTVNDNGEEHTIKLHDVSSLGDTGRLIQQVARIFGKRVQAFSSDTLQADGMVQPNDDKTVYLNTTSSISPLAVFGHELLHLLKRDNPIAYRALATVIGRNLDQKGRAGFREYYGKGADLEELTADLMGNQFQDPEFWSEVFAEIGVQAGDQAKGVIARLSAAVNKAVGSFLKVIQQGGFKSDQFVKDADAVKAAVKQAVVQYAQQQKIPAMQMEAEQARATSQINMNAGSAKQTQQTQQPITASTKRSETPDSWKATPAEIRKADNYEEAHGILPYTSEGQITAPVQTGKFSVKRPYTEKDVAKGKSGNDPMTGLPLNKNGTVTLYFPTNNETARELARTKRLKGATPDANRVYLTNESSGPKVMANPGNIDHELDGANVLIQVDPSLLHLDQEHADGRKDFFIPIAEGNAFKSKMTKLFTLDAPRSRALSENTKLTDLERRIGDGVNEFLALDAAGQRARLKEAKQLLRDEHNVGTLLGVNGKLEKTNIGGYGLNNYNGKDVMSLGLGLASAQKINEQNLSSCPKSAICEGLCLGETSGQNLLYGGEGQFKSGPRLSQYLKTEAMVQNPEAFAVVLYSEIAKFQRAAAKEDYQPTVRLNVTSDFRPQVFEGIINAFPGVMFYDYTKLPTKTIAPNHHLTYSSTGASQIVDGKVVINPESNWDKMVERMKAGDNVAMAFTSRNDMPKYVIDGRTGQKFQVWDGDNYDARFLDPKPGQQGNELNQGMIIGLTNKDKTTKPEDAAVAHKGFFLDYDAARDGDTLVIRDQQLLKAGEGKKVIPISRLSAKRDVLERNPRMEEAAQGVKEGTVTREQYEDLVNALKPVTPYTEVPKPATEAEMRGALTSDKVERLGVPSKVLKAGDPVGLRLDIPAYANHGVWVVSVHEQVASYAAGKSIGYENVAAVTNPTFGVVESAALNIAGGKPKATIAVVKGDWKPITEKQAVTATKMAMKSDKWVQVGMDPTRHAYFYDRTSMEPVVSADEAVQIGPLVMAKNPVYGKKEDFKFSRQRNDNFDRWFGDSKVVDENGEPLVVYHGTNADVQSFDPKRIGSNFGYDKDGFFFSADRAIASDYAAQDPYEFGGTRAGANVMPAYLKIENPLVITEANAADLGLDTDFDEGTLYDNNRAAITRLVKEGGYDGVKMGDDYIVYSPKQIKSATGNNGEFSPETSNISASRNRKAIAFSKDYYGAEFEGTTKQTRNPIVDTPNFKRWFKDSAIIDANGDPRVVYHTGAFDADEIVSGRELARRAGAKYPMGNEGIYFSASPSYSSQYGRNKEGAAMYPVYLSMQNPFIIGDERELTRLEKLKRILFRKKEIRNDTSVSSRLDSMYVTPQYMAMLKAEGYDGIVNEPYNEIVAFSPNQVKSATGNNGEFNPADSRITKSTRRPEFFSQLERSISEVPARLDNQPAQQWKAWLASNASKLGIKKDEIEWSGINDYLDLRGKDKVSKDEIAAYLKDNGVKVTEVMKGDRAGPSLSDPEIKSEIRQLRESNIEVDTNPEQPDVVGFLMEDGDFLSADEMESLIGDEDYPELDEDVITAAREIEKHFAGAAGSTVPKYARSELNTPGGQNYREVLLTLPPAVSGVDTQRMMQLEAQRRRLSRGAQFVFDEDPEGKELKKLKADYEASFKNNFYNSHWDEENVLAHIRMDDRTDAEGNKVLFIEEVQSDWGQQGRDRGFKTSSPEEIARKRGWRLEKEGDVYVVYDQDGDAMGDGPTAAIAAERAGLGMGSVVAGPFVTKTEGWLNLALKRIAMLAVEGGYDKVAFVNGEQSADRYSLSKHIDSIKFGAQKEDGTIAWIAMKDGQRATGGRSTAKQLEEQLGKELTNKILDNEGRAGEISGVDLEVGGEGMKGFYDQIVPQALNKLLPKLGGDKVTTVDAGDKTGVDRTKLTAKIRNLPFESKERAELTKQLNAMDKGYAPLEQVGFDVTDKMRESVSAGVPLFSPRRNIFGAQAPLANWTRPDMTQIDDVVYTMQDKMVDTKRVVDAIKSAIGNIDDKWNPYLQEELFHGRTAKETKDFLGDELRPLLEEMKTRGVTMEQLEEYLHNRYAEERNIQIAKVNPAFPDGGSGIDTADARAYLAGLTQAQRHDFQSLAKRIDAITKGTRDLLVKSGLETQETVDAWEKAYPNYVPLFREDVDFGASGNGMGTGQGFSVRGSSSKRATGSSRDVVDILANLAMQRERAIVRAEKARVATAVYGLAVQNPNTDFWLAVDPEGQKDPQAAIDDLIKLGIDPMDAQNIIEEPTQTYIDPRTGMVTQRINPALRSNPNVLAVRSDGRERYVFFNANDERAQRMVAALKNLDADQLGRVMGMMATLTRYVASVNTQYNPIFGAVNFLRDTQGALFNLSTTDIAGSEKAVMSHLMPALKGIYADVRAERRGTNRPAGVWAQLWEEFQKEGGQTGYRDQFSRSAERAEALERELKRMSEGKTMQFGRAVFDWLADYNETMENAVRLSAYKVAKDRGLSNEQAASIAKNLTVNFNRKGQVATQAGALYAFFNASVQGTKRLHETLTGPAGKKIVGGGLLLGAMQAVMLAAAGFDDDEPPDFVRERNVIIPIGGGKYLTIPMPLGFHVIPNTSRVLTEFAMSGWRDPAKRVGQIFGAFLDAFNPIGNAGWSVQTIAPTVADPLVALAENRDYTGKTIAKKDMNSLDPTPGYTRAKDTASWFSKQLSYYLNLASGGTKYKPGLISPTPDQIDYLIGQATGGVGRELMKAEQAVSATVTGEDLPPNKVPLVGRFYGDTNSKSAEANRFYENIRRINEHENEVQGRRKNKENPSEYIRENPEARLVNLANTIERDVSQLRKRKRELIEKGASPESVKIVETQIATRMKRLNDRVKQLQQQPTQ